MAAQPSNLKLKVKDKLTLLPFLKASRFFLI